jgi:hypothetical protein
MVEKLKVGRNLVSKDADGWLVEIFEFNNEMPPKGVKIPMYSVFDVYKSKAQAIRVAKLVNRNNAHKMAMLKVK